jgi:hypothetical protein
MPMANLFTTGTVNKGGLFNTLNTQLVTAGWVQISTDVAGDGYVYFSSGQDGNQRLFINFKDGATTTGFVGNNTGAYVQVRNLLNYIPNAGGTGPGTVTAQPNAWYNIALTPSNASLTLTTPYTYYISTNKNRMILFLQPPVFAGTNAYCWLQGSLAMLAAENNGQNNVTLSTCTQLTTNAVLFASNTAGASAYQSMLWYYTLPPSNPDVTGKYHITQLYVGSATEGYRAKLDDLYILPNKNVINGDSITIGSEIYQVIYTELWGSGYVNSFPTNYFAIRIS